MTDRQNWQTAFLNQARVDWEAYQKARLGMWPECHRLLFLQRASEKLAKAPPVFPIMLYNGKRRWTSPLSLADLVEGHELLGEHTLHFRYFPIIENAFSRRMLLQIGNIVSTLFLAEAHYDFDLLTKKILALVERAEDKEALSLFLNWLKQLFIHGRIAESDYHAFERIYQDKEEVNMLIESIRKEKAQLREGGRREGKREGRLKIARLMLQRGEPVEKIKLYTELSEAAIRNLQQKLKK